MKGTSYLLEVDGSAESRSMAYLTWELAKQSGARVATHHVVDTAAIWRFLGYDLAGFVGSGLYMDARERMTEIMQSIGEALMVSYGSQIAGQALEFENYIDQGDPATEIAKRARDHDMVVIGHHRRSATPGRQRMFEKLAETCACPILVVGNSGKPWSKVQMFINNDIAVSTDIPRICQLGAMVGMPVEVFLENDIAQEDADRFTMGDWSRAFGVRSIKRGSFNELIAAAPDDVLVVAPSDVVTGRSNARYRTRLRAFLDQSENRSLLLWRQQQVSRVRLAS